jgi:hypothetical protein
VSARVANAFGLGLLALIAGLLVRIEMRSSAQARELEALHRDLAAMRGDGPAGAAPPAPPPVVVAPSLDADALDAIARAVVRAQAERGTSREGSAADPADTPPRTVAEEEAVSRATDLAKNAVLGGHLSREDVTRMRQELDTGKATDAERDAIRSEIAVAINAGKLRPADRHYVYP